MSPKVKSRRFVQSAVSREGVLKIRDAAVTDTTAFQEQRRERFVAKPLCDQFFRAMDKEERTWDWLRKGRLKKETEGLITAAQDQALRRNSIKHRIDKQDVAATCRMCGQREETVGLVVAEYTFRCIIRTAGDMTKSPK